MNSHLTWFTSSYSGSDTFNCVEVASSLGAVHVRDSKAPDGPVLCLSSSAWAAFATHNAERTGVR